MNEVRNDDENGGNFNKSATMEQPHISFEQVVSPWLQKRKQAQINSSLKRLREPGA
jgi:hypothetical protein